jgi:hypothetical protein
VFALWKRIDNSGSLEAECKLEEHAAVEHCETTNMGGRLNEDSWRSWSNEEGISGESTRSLKEEERGVFIDARAGNGAS